MSWVRFGNLCRYSLPPQEMDQHCENCPGSSVYVYEHVEGGFICEGCDFKAAEDAGMVAHLQQHQAQGDHIRPSLLLRPTPRGE